MTDGQIQRKTPSPRRRASKANVARSFSLFHTRGICNANGPEGAPPATQQDDGGGEDTPSDSCRQQREDADTADYARILLDLARGNDGD